MNSSLTLSSGKSGDNDSLFYHEDIGGHTVRFRKIDSFGSLTDLCKIYGKRAVNFFELPGTKRFITALSEKTGERSENLTSAHQNGPYRGTYVHPMILIEAARWCDAAFSVACSMVVLKVLSLQGKVHENGDVSLPMNAGAVEAGPCYSRSDAARLAGAVRAAGGMHGALGKTKRQADHRSQSCCLWLSRIAPGTMFSMFTKRS